MPGRVYNGTSWIDVLENSGAGNTGNQAPVLPILSGEDTVFVSIPSYRDGKRCAKTLTQLFEKAKDPDKVFIGLIEQNYETDLFCLEAYCKEHGVDIYRKQTIRADTTKIIATNQRKECPRIDQIRNLAVHHVDAKGPTYARSLVRKLLGNEEFCLQIDAHTDFIQDWDELLRKEWAATGNEFGIISTVPASLHAKETSVTTVPRQCAMSFADTGVPAFMARGDGKVDGLEKPLLAHGWSAGFSFAKCHLEESAPYDPYTPYVMGVEQFARYARFWTRGYDVYTPTKNIVYHNFQPQEDGHGSSEWNKQRRERIRLRSLARVRTYLGVPEVDPDVDLNNLGIYGLGKRRTLQQLADFLGLDFATKQVRTPIKCVNHQWVPYDANISPVDNLYDKPNDLDPQPEYPLRNALTFYKPPDEEEAFRPMVDIMGDGAASEGELLNVAGGATDELPPLPPTSPFPPASILLSLWVLGLILWCMTFMNPGRMGGGAGGGKGKRPRRTKSNNTKDV